jgi:hypothetical protein
MSLQRLPRDLVIMEILSGIRRDWPRYVAQRPHTRTSIAAHRLDRYLTGELQKLHAGIIAAALCPIVKAAQACFNLSE